MSRTSLSYPRGFSGSKAPESCGPSGSPYRELLPEPLSEPTELAAIPASPARRRRFGHLQRTFRAKPGLDDGDKLALGLLVGVLPLAVFFPTTWLFFGLLALVPLLRGLDRWVLQWLEVCVHTSGVKISRRFSSETILFDHVAEVRIEPDAIGLTTSDRRFIRIHLRLLDDPPALIQAIVSSVPLGLVKRVPQSRFGGT